MINHIVTISKNCKNAMKINTVVAVSFEEVYKEKMKRQFKFNIKSSRIFFVLSLNGNSVACMHIIVPISILLIIKLVSLHGEC